MSIAGAVYDAITTVVGGAMSLISPARATRYRRERDRYRDYVAASSSGPNQLWAPSNTSADLEVWKDAERVRSRVRDLVRNNGLVSGAVKTQTAAIVGTGIRPQAQVLEADNETLDEKINDEIESAFERWAENAGIGAVQSFYEAQELIVGHLLTDGEILHHDVFLPTRTGNGYRIELLECDHLDKTRGATFSGIDYDALGRPKTFYLWDQHPGGMMPVCMSKDVPAADIIHLFLRDRVSQRRGVSPLASVVMELYDMGELRNSELLASRIASAFAIAVKSKNAPDWMAVADANPEAQAARSKSTAVKHEYLESGKFVYMSPDEEIEVINGNRPNANFSSFLRDLKRDAAVGMQMSYEGFAGDYSQSNYSSTRQALIAERRMYRRHQQNLIRHYLTPIYRRWLALEVMAGGIPSLPWRRFVTDRARYESVTFQCPGFEWVDPQKDAEANKLLLELGLTTRSEIAEGLGKDFPKMLKTLAWEKKRMQELGIWEAPAALPNSPSANVPPEIAGNTGETPTGGGSKEIEAEIIGRSAAALPDTGASLALVTAYPYAGIVPGNTEY